MVVPRNLKNEQYIKDHSLYREKLNGLWYYDKKGYQWINTGDKTCIFGPAQVPTDLYATPIHQGMMSMDRNMVETDYQYQQIVVGLVIHSGPKIFLLKCINGDMEGHLTLIQGHVNASRSIIENMPFGEILRENIIRETIEEVKFPFNPIAKKLLTWCVFDKNIVPKLKFLTYDVSGNDKNISSYHIGYIFDINIPDKFKYIIHLLSSNEKYKNSCVVYDIREGIPELADSWLVEIIKYYRKYDGYGK